MGGSSTLFWAKKKKKESTFLSFSFDLGFSFLFLTPDIGFVRKKNTYMPVWGKQALDTAAAFLGSFC